MAANVTNQVSFLKTARNFPNEINQLTVEMNKAYIDIATAVNNSTKSFFSTSVSSLNGENWFLTMNQKQQGFRQAYPFTSTANIPHNLNVAQIERFVRMFGAYTDGTNWYGLIAGSNVAIAGQVSFYVTSTNIVFLSGAGAPSVTKGTVVLEWLSQS